MMYYVLKLLHLDSSFMIQYTPNVFHALLSLVADWYFVKVVLKLNADKRNDAAAKMAAVALLVYYTTWYSTLLMVRTFSNTIEAVFNAVIMHKWLKISGRTGLVDADAIVLTALMTLSFIMRNTSVVPWLIPMAYKVLVDKTFTKFVF